MTVLNNGFIAMNDVEIIKTIGEFIQAERIKQNKTQKQLAEDVGINRSNLSEIENGKNFSMRTFIQVLRSLNQLQNLEVFKSQIQISPLQLAKIELKRPKRASRKNNIEPKQKSDW
jgi:transcriptional regulator with XRE-family HTH domain